MITAHIDYITITVHDLDDDKGYIISKVVKWFHKNFIDWSALGYGGLGYRACDVSPSVGARLYTSPARLDMVHCHMVLPSKALKYITDVKLFLFINSLQHYKITRLDLAIDGTGMTPHVVRDLILSGCVRWKGDRTKIKWIDSPNKIQEDNKTIGCQTIYAGTRSSGRLLRVYNMHGFNRIELEIRSKYADKVFRSIDWSADYLPQFVSKVRDYIDFYSAPYDKYNPPELYNQWIHAISEKSGQKLYESLEVVTVEKAKEWLINQAGAWLKAISIIEPDFYENLLDGAELKQRHIDATAFYNNQK